MSFNSIPPQQQSPVHTPKNDGKKWIYVVLVAALLGTWGYMFYDKSKTTETITQLQSQYTNADSARNVLQDEYNEVRSELDSLTGTNITLEGELAEKRNEIERLKQNIKSELSKKNGDLNKAKMMIAELRGKVTDLLAEVSKLKEENQQLTAANTQLATEKAELGVQKKTVEETLQKTNAEKNNLQDIASTLHASAISIQAVNMKNSGKEKETSTARRTDMLRINFQIDENRIAPSGSKELYVVLIAPDGNTVSNPNNGSGVISTREMGEKTYTKKALVNYKQGVVTPVSVEWRQESAFQVGQYKVEIYHNGFKIGEGYTSLKKGGLFS